MKEERGCALRGTVSIAECPCLLYRFCVEEISEAFWLANLFAATGNQAKTFGIAWVALEISNSQLWVGLSLGAMALPIVVLSLLSGAIVDRLPRRRIILLSYLVLSVILFLAVYLIVSDSLYLWHLPMISLGAGAVFAFMRPAKEVFIVESGETKSDSNRKLPEGAFR